MPRQTRPASAAAAAVAIAACAFDAAATPDGSGRVLLQLTPPEDFLPSDGRPMDVPAWRINGQIAQRVIAATNTAAQPPVIDYEHQTLHKEANGQPAPAAGWIHGLRWIEGRGLFAETELTERARQAVAAGEYRYFSPVFKYHKRTGELQRILMGALTNYPAVHGMEAINLHAAATARFFQPEPEPETTVNLLEQLLAALGLPKETDEATLVAACTAHKAQADAARAALQLDGAATAESVTAACTSLRTAAANTTPDPAKFVPIGVVQELQTNVAALTARVTESEADKIIQQGIEEARLYTPQLQEHARKVAKENGIAALTAFVQAMPVVAALTGTQTQGKPPAGQQNGLSQDEMAVAAACGLTPEQYATGKA